MLCGAAVSCVPLRCSSSIQAPSLVLRKGFVLVWFTLNPRTENQSLKICSTGTLDYMSLWFMHCSISWRKPCPAAAWVRPQKGPGR